MSEETTVFVCGAKPDHECDNDGPEIFGGDGVATTDVRPVNAKGYTWGSVTCSKCGSSNMARSMWGGF